MRDEMRVDTLDFVFDLVRDAPEKQLHDLEALDNKMVQIFGAASIVIGLAGVSDAITDRPLAADVLLVAALVTYVATAIVAFFHLRLREFRRSLHADVLWDEMWQLDPTQIKHVLVDDVSRAYRHNKLVLHEKGRTILAGLILAGLEVMFVGGSITWSRLGLGPPRSTMSGGSLTGGGGGGCLEVSGLVAPGLSVVVTMSGSIIAHERDHSR